MANRRGPAVSISVHPLWRLRITQELPRYLLYAACAAGLLASARFAIAPPRPRLPPAIAVSPPPDLAAEGYASLFARRYLTWDAAQPQTSQQQLAPLLGPGLDSGGGLRLPASGEQRVEWAEVVQGRELGHGEDVYTVAAQTNTAGLLHLTVRVVRRADGSLAIDGYPAFVGAPAPSADPPTTPGAGPIQGSARARAKTRAQRPPDLPPARWATALGSCAGRVPPQSPAADRQLRPARSEAGQVPTLARPRRLDTRRSPDCRRLS